VSLLLLVLCEYVKVLELHAFILGGNFLDVLLSLLVLAELTDEDLVVELHLLDLLALLLVVDTGRGVQLCLMRDCLAGLLILLLKLLDRLVVALELLLKGLDLIVFLSLLFKCPDISLTLLDGCFNLEVSECRWAD